MERSVGFIGLGIMGDPMVRNMLSGGYSMYVYNRTPVKADPLKEVGAVVAQSPLDVGKKAGVIILMLTGPEAIDAVLWDENGLLGEDSRCHTVINMSTVTPAYTKNLEKRLRERKVQLIDAPVSGSKKPAEEGTLVILAGGPQESVSTLEPLLLTMGKKVVYCGAVGAGSNMKMFINLLLCTMISGLAESLTLGEKCGLSLDTMLETVLAGPLGCGLFTMKENMFKSGEYPVQFPFKHMYKDLNFILSTAKEKGMDAKIGETLKEIYEKGIEMGFYDLDFTAVKKVIESY